MNTTKKLLLVSMMLAVLAFFSSCDPNNSVPSNSAAGSCVGTYTGTVQISGDTTIQNSSGYVVNVSAVTSTRILIESDHFQSFEAEVMKLPTTVTSTSTEPAQISYTSIVNQMTIQHTIGNNDFQYTGSK